MLHILDCRGLVCPMPLLKLKLKLKQMSSGDQLKLWLTDTGSKTDIPRWLNKVGMNHQTIQTQDGLLILIKK
ncbi:sulfurtransferase TusA family protein [Gayadomonas joobiniege]|uniref:sulfurtransferase TusA family protein n=1 Tax=Gayadomonas joobiniege TaxID=1234606 RepID=UPI00036D3477|nr:sulfurtransferase TusA family protein [Gayadomonas joobiniege]